ncbi:RNA-binding protein 33 isoform X2 [Sinocyclocheilus rhinocerous]|uniref:RNA-binding protein 33 isoform X2 n=1 Tax=Sinocyclocheilus rhinocerous TaxID=307959 RepID=UPI0007B8827C|nr:PREDICTED: RNA-binding protein 33-like isoform X2 [Sinocyclocheilus rhinocerous]
MATNVGDDEFDEYDKPGAERSRRRRGEDDDLESDLEEGDLLEEDWLSSKKNPSEMSDEELNDDLLQSDEEDQNASGQGEVVSLNATLGLGTSGHLQDEDPDGGGYTEYAYEETEGGQPGFSQGGEYEGNEYQGEDGRVEYTGDQNCEEYQDEVLELQIDEPLDDDFQVDEYPTEYREEQTDRQEVPEEEEHKEETEEQDNSQVTELEEVENENDPEAEAEPDADVKEESDEEEEDIEESGRLRFKTERKDDTVVRLSDATSKRRNIPDTLELSDAAKADLREFEERERQRKQGRFGGRGRGADGGRGGMAGRGGVRGRGGAGGRGAGGRGDFPLFGMGGFRGDGVGSRGRINEQRPPLMQVNLGMQQLRMTPPLQHHHHQSRLPGPRGSGGPGLFPDPGTPIPQQPLQLMMPRLAHHSPGPRTQHDTHVPCLLNSPPRHSRAHPNQHQQHQQYHPKNIHINPHFRGPSSSPVQVPSMPPVQNQPRPNIAPQRLPAPPDFQQHLQGNFGPPQRSLPPQDQWRGPPPHHQDPEHFFPGEPHFSGQHMFDQPGPAPLMNNSVLPISGHGPPSFSPQGGLGSPGFGSLGLRQNQGPQGGGMFQREPPRLGLAPQHGGPPGPCGFVGHRQPFSPQQQGPPFSPQHVQFGMQVRQRGLMQQPLHHDLPLSHQPLHQQQQHQQHRQDLPPQGLPHSQPPPQHQQHHQHHPRDQHPMVHLSQPHFRQSIQSGNRQMQSRPQGNQQRNNHARPKMTLPPPLQQIPPQRNSNLRELPIATSNNNNRPSVPSGQAKPVTRATQNVRQGQAARAGPAGRGGSVAQGLGAAKAPEQPSVPEMKKECPAAQSSTTPEDPDEDEETRQYRLKIEEQKRLREEILKRKEQRRQMQAGMRKKELMERISGQNPNQTPQTPIPTPNPTPAAQPSQPVPSLISNGTPQNPSTGLSSPRPTVKARLQNTKPLAQTSGWSGPQKQQSAGPDASQQGQWQPQQKRTMTPQNTQRQGAAQTSPLEEPLGQPQPGGKRTVMQRASSTESPQVPQKVRVVKRLGEQADAGPNTGPPQQQQQQPIGRPAPQQRLGPIRKVTMATGGVQNQQQAGRGMANQTNRVVVRGRARGRGGGRVMMQQNPRAQDCQRSTVCIEGLSTTTTNKQLTNLLNSIGPVEMFTMLPEQRKAIAKFVNSQHAASFQHSFHRHMIDLSHIDVSIIDG